MSLRTFAPSADERVIAGVCAGIARPSGSTPLSSGSSSRCSRWPAGQGSSSTWLSGPGRSTPGSRSRRVPRGRALLSALGLSTRSVVGIALIAGGLALAWRQGGSFRPDAPLSYGGLAVAALGTVVLLSGEGTSSTLLGPGAVAGALLLIGGPWVWRLALERDAERTARIRTEERSDVAARVHDSVLQTLALIQRHADDPRRVASLARRQERELRGWLYADQPLGDDSASLNAALEAAAGDVEELHGVRVELASAGDCPVDASVGALGSRRARR